jgi:hypothetical protein
MKATRWHLSVTAACAVLIGSSGCVCRDGGFPPRTVTMRVQPVGRTVTMKTVWGETEQELKPDGQGIYTVHVPAMGYADNVWFGLITIPTYQGDRKPFLHVSTPTGKIQTFSARQLSGLPVDTNGISILKLDK